MGTNTHFANSISNLRMRHGFVSRSLIEFCTYGRGGGSAKAAGRVDDRQGHAAALERLQAASTLEIVRAWRKPFGFVLNQTGDPRPAHRHRGHIMLMPSFRKRSAWRRDGGAAGASRRRGLGMRASERLHRWHFGSHPRTEVWTRTVNNPGVGTGVVVFCRRIIPARGRQSRPFPPGNPSSWEAHP